MANCLWCDEPILPGENSRYPDHPKGYHWQCGLRSVVGGLNHLNKLCRCCGGTLPPDPEGPTRRQAAEMAAHVWLARMQPLDWD